MKDDTLRWWNITGQGVEGRRDAQSDSLRFYLKDHLGSTRAVVDEKGTVVETRDYYPFGGLMPQRQYQRGDRTLEKFTGKERDELTGLDYFGARYYDAALGRWHNPDPMAEKYLGYSPYNYTLNNPINAFDPDGKRVFFVGGAGNDQDGWNYINRFRRAFTNAGIQGFTRVNATRGQVGDIWFTGRYRNTGYERGYSAGLPAFTPAIPVRDEQIDNTLDQIRQNLSANPLGKDEQLNLAGYSYGSVLQAQVALRLADSGTRVDNLILIGAPISEDSDLYRQLTSNSNIGNVLRYDISGDLLSNPQDIWDYLKGGFQICQMKVLTLT